MSEHPFDIQVVPAALRQLPQWVVWRIIVRDGKPTKCPMDAKTGGPADSTDPATWATFEQAMAAWQQSGQYAGVGFVFTNQAGFCGVDLDDSVDPATGELKPWGRQIVEQLNSYTEISPSGGGVKVFIRATKPGNRCRKAYHDGEVEIYDSGRFFTVTGRRMDFVSAGVEDRQGQLDALYVQVFGPIPPPAAPPATPPAAEASPAPAPAGPHVLTDDEIQNLATGSKKNGAKFSALWAGRWNDYFNSASEADSSVIFTLAFYSKDPVQIDRLFRQSKLFRPKWDEQHGQETYGQTTIAKALSMVTKQYQPKKGRAKKGKPPAAQHPTTPANPSLPQIIIDDIQLGDLTAQAMAALNRANSPPQLFVRSGTPCRVVCTETGEPGIDPLDKVKVRSRLTDVATFFNVNKQGNLVGTNPPLYLAENVLAQGAWPFPPLIGIARSPILRHDGTICTTPGYDAESRLCYSPAPGLVVPPIPDSPTPEQVEAAVNMLVDLIAEFPFADSSGLANSLSILFSVLMRPVISGHVPLAIVDAPVQGTGKSLMISALAIVAVGSVAGESIPDDQNDDEWRKKITSILLKAPPFVLLDNIPDNTTINAPPMAAMLTNHQWSDRLLGGNNNVQLPARTVWVATGNNLRVAGDMPRRCYTVRMDANVEEPWHRTGFTHSDLEQYALANRGPLLAAAFTVIRAWYAAGQPKADVPILGSFQGWADIVGSVMAHAGITGFLANLDDTRSVQDEDTLQWKAFFAGWWDHFHSLPVTTDEIAQRILSNDGLSDEPLPEPLLINREKGEGSLKRSIGRNLSRLMGRIFEGRKLCDAGVTGKTHVRKWRLEPLNDDSGASDADRNLAFPGVTSPFDNNLASNLAQGVEQ